MCPLASSSGCPSLSMPRGGALQSEGPGPGVCLGPSCHLRLGLARPRAWPCRVSRRVCPICPRAVSDRVSRPARYVSGRALHGLRAPRYVSVAAGRTLERLEMMSTLSTNHARACRVLVPCRPAPERAQGWGKVPRWHAAKKLWSRSTSCRRTTDLEITHFQPCTVITGHLQ